MIMKKLLALILVIVGLCPTMIGCIPENTTPTDPTEQTIPLDKGEQVRQPQDVSEILADTLAQLAVKVPEPTFGTLVGEWTVLCLARGDYFTKDDPYFAGYYSRIEAAVQENASSVGKTVPSTEPNPPKTPA